jgi:hypothetical protein
MRDLVGMGLAESGTSDEALNIRLCCWTIAVSANFGDPQNIRHDKVGDSKAIRREPLTFASSAAHRSRRSRRERGLESISHVGKIVHLDI